MLTLGLAIGFALCTFLLATLSLRQAMRWVKAEKPTFLRALGLAVVLWFISTLCVGFSFGLPGVLPADAPFLWVSLGLFFAQVVVDCVLIRWIVQVSFGKAVLVWFGWLVAGAVSVAFAFFVVKPYLVEAFIIPTNNMAPTVIGWHEVGTCPLCGGELTIPVHLPDAEFPLYHRENIGICEKCLKTSVDLDLKTPGPLESRPGYQQTLSPDRIMCNKLLAPRRWEVVIYRHQKHPKVKYLMRLVGLPGETVVIKEGAVWIDGVKQTPPAEIASLEYTPAEFAGPTGYATEENPLKLGASECFVLGDFSKASADSRYDGPVPWENIEGVLGLRYYPFARWKLWR